MIIRIRKLKKFVNKIGTTAITSALCLLFLAGSIHLYIEANINGLDNYFSQLSNKNNSASLVADKFLQGEGGIYNLGLIFNQEIAYRNIGEHNYDNAP